MGARMDYFLLCAETEVLERRAVWERDHAGGIRQETLDAYQRNQEAHLRYQDDRPRRSFLA